MSRSDGEWKSHPSFGHVRLSRISGRAQLYGSHVDFLDHFISLSISRSEVQHHLHQDWYYANNEIIEVLLSPAQFAELLTTMNHGFGVPCTISHLHGKQVEQLEEKLPTEATQIREEFVRELKGFADQVKQLTKEGNELLEKGSKMSRQDREKLADILRIVNQAVCSNWKFALEQFQSAAEKVVTESKAEIEAMVTHTIQGLGLKKLAEETHPFQVLQLPKGETNED